MKKFHIQAVIILAAVFLAAGCKKKIKQQEDELYSRHLQRHVKLSIINTPVPKDKSQLNLLLLNGGQDMALLRVKETVDSLYSHDLIKPLLVVGIHAEGNREYGVTGYPDYTGAGDKAGHYAAFIDNELYAFAKKKAGVRKFSSVVIAGCAAGGLSAFDIAWDHADKIDKTGVFSGAFSIGTRSAEDPDYSDKTDRVLLNKIRSSRKRPHLSYWFYGDDEQETGMRYHDSISINHTKDLIALLNSKNVPARDITYIEAATGQRGYAAWSRQFPAFLLWAFGKR